MFLSFPYILLLFVVLISTQEIFHRYPRFTLAFFSIASIILFPCWVLLVGVEDWFAWIKVFSVAIGIIVLSLFRTTKLGNTKLLQWAVYLVLILNILEAVVKDAVAGNIVNYFNATAGILLIATLNRLNSIHIDAKGGHRDLHWGSMSLMWIVGYTIWNWVFVYLNLEFQSSLPHIAVLASALVVAFINKDRWLQTRAYTLGTYFILYHSLPHLISRSSTYEYNGSFGLFISMVSFGFMIAYSFFFVRRYTSTK